MFWFGPPWWPDGKETAYSAGDSGSIPGWGRSPGEGNGNPLQYFFLGNPMDKGDLQVIVHGVAESLTQLSNYLFHFSDLEMSSTTTGSIH